MLICNTIFTVREIGGFIFIYINIYLPRKKYRFIVMIERLTDGYTDIWINILIVKWIERKIARHIIK